MKKYTTPTARFFELRAAMGFAQSNTGGNLSKDIFGGGSNVIDQTLDD